VAKVKYVEKEEAPAEIAALYDQIEKGFGMVPNVIKAMANSPSLLQGFMPYLRAVLGPSRVEAPLKELAILTTTKLNGCSYCTAHHTVLARRAGVDEDKIQAVPDETAPVFTDKERAVVRFAKEVTKNVAASDEAIEEVRKHFDEGQLVELNLVVGCFNVLTRFADTFKVDLEH